MTEKIAQSKEASSERLEVKRRQSVRWLTSGALALVTSVIRLLLCAVTPRSH